MADGFGGADILFNNAGTGSNETILDAPDEKWQAFWELHVMAAVRLARGLVPAWRARRWSRRAQRLDLRRAAAGVRADLQRHQAALMMFSKNLANEVVDHKIRVNCVNPGLMLTPDWVNTAKELPPAPVATGRVPGRHRPRARADQALRRARGGRGPRRVPLLGAGRYSVGSTYYVDGGWLRTV